MAHAEKQIVSTSKQVSRLAAFRKRDRYSAWPAAARGERRWWKAALEASAEVVSITSYNEWGEGTQVRAGGQGERPWRWHAAWRAVLQLMQACMDAHAAACCVLCCEGLACALAMLQSAHCTFNVRLLPASAAASLPTLPACASAD